MNRLKQDYQGKVEFRIYNVDTPGGEANDMANKLGVQYVPTFFFANADGTLSGQVVGEMTEEALRAKLDGLK